MTDSKDMGIFGFGKDQDMRIFILIGVVLVVFAAAYLYYTNTSSDAQKALEDVGGFLGFVRRHLATIIVSTILVILVTTLIILKLVKVWPFGQQKEAVTFYNGLTDKDLKTKDAWDNATALFKANTPQDKDLKAGTDVTHHIMLVQTDKDGKPTKAQYLDGSDAKVNKDDVLVEKKEKSTHQSKKHAKSQQKDTDHSGDSSESSEGSGGGS